MADADPAATLGEVIRRQRELNRLSMRQFAQMAGISNPYLSQIERGLRAPSEQVLEGIASALKLSAEALYEQAGVARPGQPGTRSHGKRRARGTLVPRLLRHRRQAGCLRRLGLAAIVR